MPWSSSCNRYDMRRIVSAIYFVVVAVMAAATFVEKGKGTEYVSQHVYGAPWFVALWAALAAAGAVCLFRRVRKRSVLLLHVSFLLILAGAALTHFTSAQGYVCLRVGGETYTYDRATRDGMREERLPFSIRLDDFTIRCHNGTTAPSDYESRITITDGDRLTRATISMNNVCSYRGYRLYQGNYDRDGRGSVLAVNADPVGIPVTYAGYALLFLSLVIFLIDPAGAFRRSLRIVASAASGGAGKAAAALCLLVAFPLASVASATLDGETAKKFGEIYIVHNDRVCQLHTFAIDFTKKIYGKASYKGYSAEQVLAGLLFWPGEWAAEPIIKVRGGELRSTLQWSGHVPLSTIFNKDMGGYVLRPYVEEYYNGNDDRFHKDVAQLDDVVFLLLETRAGTLLKIYPQTDNGATLWYGYDPHTKYPSSLATGTILFMRRTSEQMADCAARGDMEGFRSTLDEILSYQRLNGGGTLPSPSQVKAERAYNAVPFATVLFAVNLALGFAGLVCCVVLLSRRRRAGGVKRALVVYGASLLASFLALTCALALRWIVSGRIPMSNGYETMLTLAWFLLLMALPSAVAAMSCRPRGNLVTRLFVPAAAFTMSGFFLLVSHIGQMDPAIGQIMPVLDSPLLSVHVSFVMLSFALLAMTFVCGVAGMAVHPAAEELRHLSLVFLCPAIAALGFGIFIGAIWANMSWGRYWSWDPKETWALITFMVYAVPLHARSMPCLRRPVAFHAYMVLAFATILMTYFGVNYFLGGMHSYA